MPAEARTDQIRRWSVTYICPATDEELTLSYVRDLLFNGHEYILVGECPKCGGTHRLECRT